MLSSKQEKVEKHYRYVFRNNSSAEVRKHLEHIQEEYDMVVKVLQSLYRTKRREELNGR